MSGSKASRRVAPADSSFPPAFTEAPAGFPGEDVASASVLREHYGIPPEECLELEEGTCWCRRIEPAGWRGGGAPASEETESNAPAASTSDSQEVESSRIPIVVCSGGTGAGMFYKQFATDLAASYQGPVIIFDRFNIGLSDRMELRPGDVIFVRTNPIVKFSAMIDILLGLDRRITDVGNRL